MSTEHMRSSEEHQTISPADSSTLSLLARVHHSRIRNPEYDASRHQHLIAHLQTDSTRKIGEVLLGMTDVETVAKKLQQVVNAFQSWTNRNDRKSVLAQRRSRGRH